MSPFAQHSGRAESGLHEPLPEERQNHGERQTVTLFVWSAHNDEALKKSLDTHLSSLQRQRLIEKWSDRDIKGRTAMGGADRQESEGCRHHSVC